MNIQKDENLLKEQTRLTKAKADLTELKVKVYAGELVNREEFEEQVNHEWQEAVMKVRTKILAIESLASQLVGLDVQDIARVLKQKAREILNELAEEFK